VTFVRKDAEELWLKKLEDGSKTIIGFGETAEFTIKTYRALREEVDLILN